MKIKIDVDKTHLRLAFNASLELDEKYPEHVGFAHGVLFSNDIDQSVYAYRTPGGVIVIKQNGERHEQPNADQPA